MVEQLHRREFLTELLILCSGFPMISAPSFGKENPPNPLITKKIPKSGEALPVIGMGTWITFNVGGVKSLMDKRTEILRHFFARGGALIDSSPMYGSSQKTLGYALDKISHPTALFSADKIWTDSTKEGLEQFLEMQELWRVKQFDLVQVHNLLNWKSHLKTLLKLKKERKVRYIGVTTSHGRRHSDLISIMKNEPIDFVQATYNLEDREVENKILPLAQKQKIAFIANRPFGGGQLFDKVRSKKLPSWSQEFGAVNWAQYFLKFVVSHPGVSCAIPATSQLAHMKENMGACYGRLPNRTAREQMVKHYKS